jgi:hypothetical protein
LSLNRNPHIEWFNEPLDIRGKTELQISDSDFNAIMDINKFEPQIHLGPAMQYVQFFVDAVVHLVSFQTGNAYSALLERVILPDGKMSPVHNSRPELAKYITLKMADFEQITGIVVMNHALGLALRDLTAGLRGPGEGGVGATRAIEGIRNYFVPLGTKPNQGWELMRNALNATESYVKSITEQSKGPRHADWFNSEEQLVHASIERAWTLMNRFLEYRKRNDQPLPPSEFPLLDMVQA